MLNLRTQLDEKGWKVFYFDLRIRSKPAPRMTRKTTDIPTVFHPAAGSPSPTKVKAANRRNKSSKYQMADRSHFHQTMRIPRSLAQVMAPTTTAPVSNPTIKANTIKGVIMVLV